MVKEFMDIADRVSPQEETVYVMNSPGRNSDPDSGFPLISVILPFYNDEKNIGEAVEGIIGQDYPNFELILVDDVSRDGSLKIAEDMEARDPRIRILKHSHNQGAGPARNSGVQIAGGEYLLFMDSDDILKPGALTLLHKTAVREQSKIVIGSCNQIDEAGIITDHDRARDFGCEECFGVINGEEAVRRWLNIERGGFLPVRPWGILIETEMYRKSGLFFCTGEHEDLTWTPFLYKFAGKVVYLKDIIVTYQIRQGSIINSPYSEARVRRYHKVWDDTVERLNVYDLQEYERDFKIFHIGNFLWQLSLGVPGRDVLDAAAELLGSSLSLKGEKILDKSGPDLGYMPEMVIRILQHLEWDWDIQLWTRLVSGFSDDILYKFIKKKLTAIRNMIWRAQMVNDNDREKIQELKTELSEFEALNEEKDNQISGLVTENERLRKRLIEVSFYLNTLLTDMDKRVVASNVRARGPRHFGVDVFRPSVFLLLIKRLPGIRSLREAGIIKALEKSGQFSPRFYRETYTDLEEYQGDLLLHFVRYGGYEGRSPNRYFDSKWYLNSNPIVEKKGINPLYHFLQYGMKEGLWPSPDYSPAEYRELVSQNQE